MWAYWGYLAIPLMVVIAAASVQWKWHAESRTKVKVEIFRTSGNKEIRYVEDVDGTLEVPFDKKNPENGGWTWKMGSIHTFNDIYPGIWLPAFLQTTIRTVAVNEWDVEPMSKKRDIKVDNPELIYNLENDKTSKIVISFTNEIAELRAKLQKAVTSYVDPRIVYTGLALSIIASCYCVFTVIDMKNEIEVLLKAYGLG